MKKFNSQICTTKEQSQRLLDLGLKPETADCQYAALVIDWKGNPILNPKWRFYGHNEGFVVQNFEHFERIPSWSLHRLLEMYVERYISCNVNLKELTFDWLINEIEIHITENDFNKEYLKQ